MRVIGVMEWVMSFVYCAGVDGSSSCVSVGGVKWVKETVVGGGYNRDWVFQPGGPPGVFPGQCQGGG